MDAILMDSCGICGGSGFLLGQSYGALGYPELPRNAVCVQRCDECRRWEGDEDAARMAAETFFTTYGIAGDPADQGDWYIVINDNVRAEL